MENYGGLIQQIRDAKRDYDTLGLAPLAVVMSIVTARDLLDESNKLDGGNREFEGYMAIDGLLIWLRDDLPRGRFVILYGEMPVDFQFQRV